MHSMFVTEGDKPNSTPVSIRILAGVTTGMLSVAIAHPTDVVKVRMQAQFGSNRGRYVSTSDAYKTIYTKEGMKGLWRGKGQRVVLEKQYCFILLLLGIVKIKMTILCF